MGVQSQVIAARFMLTIGHLMSVLMVAFFIEDRTGAALADDASEEEKQRAKASLTVSALVTTTFFAMYKQLGLVWLRFVIRGRLRLR